jgi:mono/diheme cytochrome c family protein
MKMLRKFSVLLIVLAIVCFSIDPVYSEMDSPNNPAKNLDMKKANHGRYLSIIAGCNDCHTPGYLLSEGKVPEKLWLTGDRFGWRGPWGTTYAINLRIFVNSMTEDQWVKTARALKAKPPMPWYALNIMKEADLRAIYHFIRFLGASGEPAPAYLPPNKVPTTPYAQFPMPVKTDRK